MRVIYPCATLIYWFTVLSCWITFLWIGMQTGANTYQQYNHMPETDRLQVPLGIHENNFGNIAIRTWNRYNVMDIECDMCEIAMGVELQQHHNASMLMHITTTLCAYYSCKYNNVWHVSYIYIYIYAQCCINIILWICMCWQSNKLRNMQIVSVHHICVCDTNCGRT